ncbi:uncharacterized protein CLUP02_11051 [Colletotrichum lupini]|uniref:Uncharacterized protein n=1 Tax=Colletotrichum lupini TaxID=145971 RepID=A0A9Q8WJ47_9PEZI|nr:uncharacterized protein CLUP02_11051 [Colletotrichum lupini]UQC85553.1 hypothetical protein CLUP02_11051 [Colletotrichum lupini]
MKPTDKGGRRGDGCGGAAFWSGRPAVKGGDGAKQEREGGNGERRRWDLDKCFCSFTATLCRYQTALDLRRVVFEIGSVDKREGGKGKEEEGGIGGEQAGGGRILHIKDKTRSRVLWFAPSCCLSFFSCPFSLSASGWLLKQHTSLQTKHCVCVCVFVFWYYVFWAAFAKPLFYIYLSYFHGDFFFHFFHHRPCCCRGRGRCGLSPPPPPPPPGELDSPKCWFCFFGSGCYGGVWKLVVSSGKVRGREVQFCL